MTTAMIHVDVKASTLGNNSPDRWLAARIRASHVGTILQMAKRHPSDMFTGDEFEALKSIVEHVQASSGFLIEDLYRATTLDDLISANNEFHKTAIAKSQIV